MKMGIAKANQKIQIVQIVSNYVTAMSEIGLFKLIL